MLLEKRVDESAGLCNFQNRQGFKPAVLSTGSPWKVRGFFIQRRAFSHIQTSLSQIKKLTKTYL